MFCEGRNTEPAYFAALGRAHLDALIEIETNPGVGVAYTVAHNAVQRAKALGLSRHSRKVLNSFEEADEVWAIFDRDEHPNFNEAVAMCQKFGVGCGRSNPCFEIWLILHEEDYDKPDERRSVQAHLGSLRPEYALKGAKIPNCADLVQRVEIAEQRAAKQLERREVEGAPYGPPSTTVGHLTRAIRDAAKLAR